MGWMKSWERGRGVMDEEEQQEIRGSRGRGGDKEFLMRRRGGNAGSERVP